MATPIVVKCGYCGKTTQYYAAPQPEQLGAMQPNRHLLASDARSIFGGQRQRLHSDAASAAPGVPSGPSGNYDKTTPISKIEPGDISTAAYDAGISFAIAGVGTAGLMYLAGYSEWHVGGPLAGFVVGAGRYFGMVNFAKSLTRIVECWVSDEVEIVEEAPGPDPTPGVPPLEVIHKNGKGTIQSVQRFSHLPANVLLNLPTFAQQAPIKGLSQTTWSGSGGLFSKPEFSQLMSALHEAGIVEWVNSNAPAQGRRVTRSGQRALAALSKMECDGDAEVRGYEHIEGT